MTEPILTLKGVSKYFDSTTHKRQKILDDINLSLYDNEIVAILGKSGSGKSTLLRIMAELYAPSKGKIKFPNIKHIAPSISLVFQTFALFPWLNVLENVELGLQAKGQINNEQKKRALDCISLIGLDGFEFAMPRELSGGMKQRVGFARGLAMDPDILLLDEPFSALDMLTASSLKNDFLKLWREKKIAVKSIVLITHSIEEAVMLADRVIILGSSPTTIMEELNISLPQPRNIKSSNFQKIVDKIYHSMTTLGNKSKAPIIPKSKEINISQKLSMVLPSEMFAILELLASKEYGGKAEVADLIHILHIKMQHVIHIIESLTIFKFAVLSDTYIKITKQGQLLTQSSIEERKILFKQALFTNIPLTGYICKIVEERAEKKVQKKRFKSHLEDYMTSEQAGMTLNAVIAWGRYAEIFSYDDNKQLFTLLPN